eukprot:scaffold18809_cov102-Isochrysis_galbana.AAC.4
MAPSDPRGATAVGGDVAVEAPPTTRQVAQQTLARRAAVLDAGGEGGQVGVLHVLRAHHRRKAHPPRLGRVGAQVLEAGGRLQIDPVLPLQTTHVGGCVLASDGGVLPRRLVPAAPARVAVHVDVWRPQRQSVVPPWDGPVVVLAAGLGARHVAHQVEKALVERRGQPDDLRKGGGHARSRHAVQRLVPPVVPRDLQPGNGGRVVAEQARLLVHAQRRHQCGGALFERLGGIAPARAPELSVAWPRAIGRWARRRGREGQRVGSGIGIGKRHRLQLVHDGCDAADERRPQQHGDKRTGMRA